MSRGFRIGTIRGIPIVIDASWLVIAALVTWAFFADLWAFDRDASLPMTIIVAIAGAVVFFGSVLAHELSHSVVAISRDIPVHRIRLFVFVQPIDPIQLNGQVVRHEPEGFAVEFEGLDAEARRFVDDVAATVANPKRTDSP